MFCLLVGTSGGGGGGCRGGGGGGGGGGVVVIVVVVVVPSGSLLGAIVCPRIYRYTSVVVRGPVLRWVSLARWCAVPTHPTDPTWSRRGGRPPVSSFR